MAMDAIGRQSTHAGSAAAVAGCDGVLDPDELIAIGIPGYRSIALSELCPTTCESGGCQVPVLSRH